MVTKNLKNESFEILHRKTLISIQVLYYLYRKTLISIQVGIILYVL